MDHFSRLSTIIVISLIVIGGGLVYWFGRPVKDQLVSNTNQNTNQVVTNNNLNFNTNQPANTNEATVSQVTIYAVAVNDNGQNGEKFGCEDSLIPITRSITPTTGVLRAALTELFTYDPATQGRSDLMNIFIRGDLEIQSLEVVNGEARVALTGSTVFNGVCDSPRFTDPLLATIKQFSTVQTTAVTVNGKTLEELTSQR